MPISDVATIIVLFIVITTVIILFSRSKLITKSGLVVALVFLIILSFKKYSETELTNGLYFSVMFYRYICVYAIFLFLVSDTLQDIVITEVFVDKFGYIIGFNYNYRWVYEVPAGLGLTLLCSLVFDGLIPFLAVGVGWSSFVYLGYAAIFFALLIVAKIALSVFRIIRAFRS